MTIIDHDAQPQDDARQDDPETPVMIDEIRTAREMIPVGPTGAAPMNFAQQVDYAKAIAKARFSLPEHLQDNIGDCLAIVDIASRTGLSAYMLAGKTYVQNKRLCFEAQAYHALAQASGLLRGDLKFKWEGEGDDMTCTVSGFLKGDPEMKVLKSRPLRDAHPGFTEKDGKKFVKGSPLWQKKPQVQLAYDTTRDWVRIYCPRAMLGIYTPDEIEDYQDHFGDGSANGSSPTLHQRLAAATPSEEGHRPGFVEQELANIAPDRPGTILPAEPKSADAAKSIGRAAAGNAKLKAAAKAPPTPAPASEPRRRGRPRRTVGALPSAATIKAAADRAEATSAATAPKEEPAPKPQPQPRKITAPETAIEYESYAADWIDGIADKDNAEARWDGERDMRDTLSVSITVRNVLHERLMAKFKEAGE